MPLHSIVHFEFYSTDFEKVKKFYGDLFGWAFKPWGEYYMLFMPPPEDGYLGGGVLFAKEPKPIQNFNYYVEVDDIDKYLEKAKAIGWEVVAGKGPIPNVGSYAQIKDFDGNLVSLYEKLPESMQ